MTNILKQEVTKPQCTKALLQLGDNKYSLTSTGEEICGENYAYRHIAHKQIVQNTSIIKPVDLFTVFPNPTNQTLYISYNNINEKAIFEMVDMMGKVLQTQAINNSRGITAIDMSSLPNGVYMIMLKQNGINKLNKRICVIH